MIKFLPLDPAEIAQAFDEHFLDRQNLGAAENAKPTRRPLRQGTP